MPTSSTLVSEIESKIDIVELIRDYVPLRKSGANWKGLSPFKPEKTPSFVVSPAKQIAYCFATNQGGGPLRMLMFLEKIEFREALQILAKRAGVELKTDTLQDAKNDEKGVLIKLYTEVTRWYQKNLQQPEGLEARQYLSGRGITPETIEKWSIGYSSDPREMFESMKKKGFTEKVLMESGVFISAYKDRFFGRVIFPIKNYRGDVIAFSGRTLKAGGDEAKYVNSPETLIFHKSDVLYGIDSAKKSISHEKKVIVVEGQMDVISLHQAGIENTVGISGTALTESHIRLIRRLTDQVYLCLDRDSAGKQAIFRSIENLQNEPVDVYVVDVGAFKDPDEFLKSGGDFHTCIAGAAHAIEFMITEGSTKYDLTTNQGKKGLLTEILKHITQTRGTVEIDHALRLIAKKLDMSLQSLYSEYNRAIRGRTLPNETVEPTRSYTSGDYLATYIIGLPRLQEIFLGECLFQSDILDQADMSVIRKILDNSLEDESKKTLELQYEEMTTGKNEDTIEKEFLELVQQTNKLSFRKLQKLYSHDIVQLQTLLALARQHNLI